MTRNVILTVIIVSLFGCSSVKIEKDFMVHEDLYRVPIIKSDSWLKAIPAGPMDAMYLRCPNEQIILIFNAIYCSKFDYANMTDDDYTKRIYLNTYFSFLGGFGCNGTQNSPLYDKKFKNLIDPVIVNKDKKQFSIVSESATELKMCNLNKGEVPIKIMDVFIEDPKMRMINGVSNGSNTRFVVFRYASPVDKFDLGIDEFKDVVSKFQWLE